jgi:DNA-binding MarR family transcriptional regulator
VVLKYPLGANQIKILEFIKNEPESAYASAISLKLNIQIPIVSIALKRLTERGFIERSEYRDGTIRKYYKIKQT